MTLSPRRPSGRFLRRAGLPALLIPLLLAGGCTSVRDALDADNVEYRNARRGPVLDVPPDLVSPKADNRYALPGTDSSQSLLDYNRERAGADAPTASTGSNVLPRSGQATIHRDGQVRWIVVEQPPEAVWPVLLDFWAVQGFNLERAQPELGIMETDWAERYQRVENSGVRGILSAKTSAVYATGERDKYRTRIERTASGGTEIYLTYYGREEVLQGNDNDRSIWQPSNDNRPALETEYLQRMLARLGNAFGQGQTEEPRQKVTTTEVDEGQARAGLSRVESVEGAGSRLVLQQDFERSWRDVGLVLDRLDFSIEDRNREQGVYNIRYVDPERRDQSQGTLSRIFSGERKDLSGQHYLLQVAGQGSDASTVEVRLADGKSPESEEDRRVAERLIRVLHENLR